jgi:hypothetical protein
MVIRTAQPDDFGPVTRLLERLGRPAVTPRNRAAVKEIYNAQLTDSATSHLVAVTGRDRVIGFCSLHFRARLNHHQPQAWIPDVIVDEGERGRGVRRRQVLPQAAVVTQAPVTASATVGRGISQPATSVGRRGSTAGRSHSTWKTEVIRRSKPLPAARR